MKPFPWTSGPWEVDSGMVQTVATHDCKLKDRGIDCGVHIPLLYADRKSGNGTTPVERDANIALAAQAPRMAQTLIRLKLWGETMGGWDSDVWRDLDRLVKELRHI